MGEKSEILFLLFSQLSVGGVVLLAAIAKRQLGLSFFRLNGMIFFLLFGVAVPAVPADGAGGPWAHAVAALTLAYAVTLFVYVVLFWIKKEYHPVVWLYAAAGFGSALIVASGALYAARAGTAAFAPGIPVSFVFSTAVLGSSMLGMLLGHRYLTSPNLPMSHLNILAWIFLVAIIFQGALSTLTFAFGLPSDVVGGALRLETVLGLFLWIRVAIGILVPLALAVMILNTIRYKANMSATGLLYIAALMVLAGEAFSRYLLLAESILL
ncbi:MAG: hypothetical protein ACOYXR_04040 [Nitrospirota bacterium]